MRDLEHLYAARLRQSYNRGGKVVSLIFKNMMILFLIVLTLAYLSAEYTNLLKSHTPFPYALTVALVLAFLLTKSSVRTLLREADLVFLLPAEPRMHRYFRAALRYSSGLQTLWMAILLVFVYPLYHMKIGSTSAFLGTAVLVLALKAWNVYICWRETLLSRGRWAFVLLRLGANLCVMMALFDKAPLLLAGAVLWPILLTFLLLPRKTRRNYPWNRLLELEEKRLSTYYAMTNFFVDIPRMKNRVKRRAWAVALISKMPANRTQPYFYLFARTFIRHSEYSGIYFRLTLTAAVALLFIGNPYVALIVYWLDMYLVGFQLPHISSELRYPELIRIYPVTQKQKELGFSWLAYVLLTTQSVILVIPMLFGRLPVLTVLLYLVGGLLFSYYMSFHRLPKRFLRMADGSEDQNVEGIK